MGISGGSVNICISARSYINRQQNVETENNDNYLHPIWHIHINLTGQLGTYKSIETYIFLCGLYLELPVYFRRDAHSEFP